LVRDEGIECLGVGEAEKPTISGDLSLRFASVRLVTLKRRRPDSNRG
jgi:hypothetical protein